MIRVVETCTEFEMDDTDDDPLAERGSETIPKATPEASPACVIKPRRETNVHLCV